MTTDDRDAPDAPAFLAACWTLSTVRPKHRLSFGTLRARPGRYAINILLPTGRADPDTRDATTVFLVPGETVTPAALHELAAAVGAGRAGLIACEGVAQGCEVFATLCRALNGVVA